MTAQPMRDQLPDLLNRVAYRHEPTLVTRQGRVVAVLASVRNWEQYLEQKAESNTNDRLVGSGLFEGKE